jgi:hypothetical protein
VKLLPIGNCVMKIVIMMYNIVCFGLNLINMFIILTLFADTSSIV